MQRVFFLILLALVTTGVATAGDIPAPSTDIRYTAGGDTLLVRVTHVVIESKVFPDIYSPGGSNDAPDIMMAGAVAYVSTFADNQYPYSVGMADTLGWGEGSTKEDHRKDVSLSMARVQDVYDRVGGKIADHVLLGTTRGVTISQVERREEVIRNFSEERRQWAKKLADAKGKTTVTVTGNNDPKGLWGPGVSYLKADGIEITTITVNRTWLKDEFRIDVGGGLLPAGQDDEHGWLSYGSLSGTLSYFPGDKFIGVYGGYSYSCKFILAELTAPQAFHGPTVGLALRPNISVFGLDIATLERVGYSYLNHAEMGHGHENVDGFNVTAQLGVLF